jgi:hypothetical protein
MWSQIVTTYPGRYAFTEQMQERCAEIVVAGLEFPKRHALLKKHGLEVADNAER